MINACAGFFYLLTIDDEGEVGAVLFWRAIFIKFGDEFITANLKSQVHVSSIFFLNGLNLTSFKNPNRCFKTKDGSNHGADNDKKYAQMNKIETEVRVPTLFSIIENSIFIAFFFLNISETAFKRLLNSTLKVFPITRH